MSSSRTLRLVKWPRHCAEPKGAVKVSLFDDLPEEVVRLVIQLMDDLPTRCRFAQFSKDANRLVTEVHGGLPFSNMPRTFYYDDGVCNYFGVDKKMMEDLVEAPRWRGTPAKEVVEYLIDKKRLGSITGLIKSRQTVLKKTKKAEELDRRQFLAVQARRVKLAAWLRATPVAVGTPPHAYINNRVDLLLAIDQEVGEYLSHTLRPRLPLNRLKEAAVRLAPIQLPNWKPGDRFCRQVEINRYTYMNTILGHALF